MSLGGAITGHYIFIVAQPLVYIVCSIEGARSAKAILLWLLYEIQKMCAVYFPTMTDLKYLNSLNVIEILDIQRCLFSFIQDFSNNILL